MTRVSLYYTNLFKHPSSWFQTVEIRPFTNGLRLGEEASAFGRAEDADGHPYLLIMWRGATPAAPFDDRSAREEVATWRQDIEARGLHVLGDTLGDTDMATTVRVRHGETILGHGPFTGTEEFIAGIDVVRCADRPQAIELAAAHPMARYHAVEVRPFYSE